MKTVSPLTRHKAVAAIRIVFLAFLALFWTSSHAAVVTLTATDSSGNSSFNAAGNWNNGQAPTAGNDYYSGNYWLNTPYSSGNVTFAGSSLTLGNAAGTALYGGLIFRGWSSPTITINDLRISKGGMVQNRAGAGNKFTLAGNITLSGTTANPSAFSFYSDGFTVTSAISGTGTLAIINSNATPTTVAGSAIVLTNAGNTYSGGTSVQNFANLRVAADGALGSGDLSLVGNSRIEFTLGTTNNYIADTAKFILSTSLASGAVNLNFSGADLIGGLSLDGGTTFLGNGSYSASQLNTLYGTNVFTGAGSLTVVPEPASIGLVSFAILGLAFVRLKLRGSRRD